MAEIDISKKTKKMLLFVSVHNPLWEGIIPRREVSQNHIAGVMGIAPSTIPAWKNGGSVDKKIADFAFAAVQRHIGHLQTTNPKLDAEKLTSALATLKAFRQDYHEDGTSIYATAEHLGMSVQQSQMIIDEVIYRRGPVFPRMYSENAGPATNVCHVYQGVYMLWVRRQRTNGNGRDGRMWLQAPLRVRYVLQIGAGYAIRCKLNAPMLRPFRNKRYFEYDGFLVKKYNRIFWLFEKRERDPHDQFHFITGSGNPYCHPLEGGEKLSRTMSGQYLTTEQDESRTIVSDSIILHNVADYTLLAENTSSMDRIEYRRAQDQQMVEIMHSTASIIDDEPTCLKLDAFLTDLERPQ